MSRCDEILERLDDAVDGRLGPELTAHLADCPRCRDLVVVAAGARPDGAAFAGITAPPGLVARLKRLPRLSSACERAQELIGAALDGTASPRERSELLEHLHTCSACRAAWESLATLREVGAAVRLGDRFKAALALSPRTSLALRRRRRFFDLRLATAAAYLLAALSVAAAGNPGAIARAGTEGMEKATFFAKAAVENRIGAYKDKAWHSALAVVAWAGETLDDARTLARRMFGGDANPAASDDVVPDENGGAR